MFLRQVTTGSTSRLTIVDHNETYGRHILEKIAKKLKVSNCLDLGCGQGDDLTIIKKHNPRAELCGIDFDSRDSEILKNKNIKLTVLDIEKQALPFKDNAFDLIIVNQVLEHTKEVFWINHEIFRCLKRGGYLFMGVPNVLSFHNRILMPLGVHPTQFKMISAHVRPFSKRDTSLFYKTIAGNFTEIESFFGSQFYPFPKRLARFLSKIFPNSAMAIFFLIHKTGEYNDEFIKWSQTAKLETNFFVGDIRNYEIK